MEKCSTKKKGKGGKTKCKKKREQLRVVPSISDVFAEDWKLVNTQIK